MNSENTKFEQDADLEEMVLKEGLVRVAGSHDRNT